jgi:hypothetical protein
MHPCGLNGIQPGASAGQVADHEAHPDGASLDLLGVLADPAPHCLTAVPGGVIPDQQQRGEALSCELGRAPRQKIDGHGTHGAPCHRPEPPLVWLLRSRPHQQSITGQRLGIGIVRRCSQRLQLEGDLCVCPAMLVGLGEPAPPDFIAKAQRPHGLGHGQRDQAVAPFCFGDRLDRDW